MPDTKTPTSEFAELEDRMYAIIEQYDDPVLLETYNAVVELLLDRIRLQQNRHIETLETVDQALRMVLTDARPTLVDRVSTSQSLH